MNKHTSLIKCLAAAGLLAASAAGPRGAGGLQHAGELPRRGIVAGGRHLHRSFDHRRHRQPAAAIRRQLHLHRDEHDVLLWRRLGRESLALDQWRHRHDHVLRLQRGRECDRRPLLRLGRLGRVRVGRRWCSRRWIRSARRRRRPSPARRSRASSASRAPAPITSLALSSVSPNSTVWPTVDNLTLAARCRHPGAGAGNLGADARRARASRRVGPAQTAPRRLRRRPLARATAASRATLRFERGHLGDPSPSVSLLMPRLRRCSPSRSRRRCRRPAGEPA